MRAVVIGLLLLAVLACAGASLLLPPDAASNRPVSAEPEGREVLGREAGREREKLLRPLFSPAGHFFDGPVTVSIVSRAEDAAIHYTLDGSEPTAASPLYARPLTLHPTHTHTHTQHAPARGAPASAQPCVVVRAVAIAPDGTRSSVVTHSYFLERRALARAPAYIVSLSTAPENLYDEESGILVPGNRRAASERLHPGKTIEEHDANYKGRGREWERPVAVEIFDGGGGLVLAQAAGLRVYGGSSRMQEQKSLRLIASRRYEPRLGRFHHAFFAELAGDDAAAVEFKNLVLHSAGQDLQGSRIRSQLFSRIAGQAGYPWQAPAAGAAVYLNGLYYGFAWLSTRVDAALLGTLLDTPPEDFVILAGGVTAVRSSPKYPALPHFAMIHAFNTLVRRCGGERMSESLYADIRKRIDVDALLLYYAIECYIGNEDWPQDETNCRVWRYAGSGGRRGALDGRWRYILYDLDNAAKLPATRPTLARAVDKSPLFAALLTRPELRARFANMLCDMAFAHFTEANVRKTMAAMDAGSLDEIRHACEHGVFRPAGLWQHLRRDRDDLLRFFRERRRPVLEDLRGRFGYTGLYQVRVDGPARLGTITGDSPEGWYFVENPVMISAALPPGRILSHWEVNGRVRGGPRLEVSARDADGQGLVSVRLVSQEVQIPLRLEAAYDRGKVCGFAVRNVSEKDFAGGFYLSDNPGKPRKYEFPRDMRLPAGAVLEFVGKGARHLSALGKRKLNFNPRRGETIYLRDRGGRVLSTIVMP